FCSFRVRKTVPVIDIFLGLNIARCDGVYPNLLRRIFQAKGFCHAQERVFCQWIWKSMGNNGERMSGGDVKNNPATLFDHSWQNSFGAVPCTFEIDIKTAVPFIIGGVELLKKKFNASIVYLGIYRAYNGVGLCQRC